MRALLATLLLLAVCAPAASARNWTDSTGTQSVEAQFVDFNNGQVRLKKANGSIITVPVGQLSQADQRYVTATAAKLAGKPTPPAPNNAVSGSQGQWRQDHPRRAEVNERLGNQNERINEGVQSGKLSPAEAQGLHQEDQQIRKEERADASQDGGHITKAEQKQLNQQENAASKNIFDEKHPDASQGQWKQDHPRRAEVNGRLGNQNERINEGVQSGKLSPAEAQGLHQEDRQIRKEERADASQDGGHITKAEQKQLNQQENAASKNIFDEKHPDASQGGGTSSGKASGETSSARATGERSSDMASGRASDEKGSGAHSGGRKFRRRWGHRGER
jgi:hypothetical protein